LIKPQLNIDKEHNKLVHLYLNAKVLMNKSLRIPIHQSSRTQYQDELISTLELLKSEIVRLRRDLVRLLGETSSLTGKADFA